MEKLDRALQRKLLQQLADVYPGMCQASDLGYTADDAGWNVNLHYLSEHGLVEAHTSKTISSLAPMVVLAKATARGLDFLQDDGGLGAILNVTTVRFEAETLRALIDARIDASDAKPEEKSAIKKKLGEMGSEALKELTKKLIEVGFKHGSDALQIVQSLAA